MTRGNQPKIIGYAKDIANVPCFIAQLIDHQVVNGKPATKTKDKTGNDRN